MRKLSWILPCFALIASVSFVRYFPNAEAVSGATQTLGIHATITADQTQGKTKEIHSLVELMRTSTNHFHSIAGTYVEDPGYNRSISQYQFEIQMRPDSASYCRTIDREGSIVGESRFDGTHIESINYLNKTFSVQQVMKGVADGGAVTQFVRPLYYVNFLNNYGDLVRNIQTDMYLGRSSIRVLAQLNPVAKQRFGASMLQLQIDKETGVLLDAELINSEGMDVQYVRLENVTFNEPIDDAKTKIVTPIGFTKQ